jgi:anion-transporting  ArsA/GET3 family ATPase
MDLVSFARASRVKILIGKGGVGKTTMTCALGRALSAEGLHVLIVELEGRPEVPRAFGRDEGIDYDGSLLHEDGSGGSVTARRVTPDEALLEYLAERSLGKLSRRLITSGVLDVVSGAIPGIREVLVLGKIKQIANEASVDVVLVDAPATGHAVSMLTSPAGVASVARTGPVREQAEQVVELLADPSRCSVLLVTIPEELPVTEAIDAAYAVEDRAGVALGPVLCNLVDTAPDALARSAAAAALEVGITLDPGLEIALDEAAGFQRRRSADAMAQLSRLRRDLPLPVIELPRMTTPTIGPAELEVLSRGIHDGFASLGGVS